MDLIRFITAGSVDDGKSTLIGRLLYDSKSILADQLEAIHRNGNTSPDLALLTDGLRAEREQGITIDVAYKYFSTPKRKFVIADAPGHVQYTRNMITGASNADLIIILIDARQGVVEQTRRHSIIASILKIAHVIVAVNKLDLIGYSQKVYDEIVSEYQTVADSLGLRDVTYIPISALFGDNVVERTEAISWYQGPSLLQLLEAINTNSITSSEDRGRFSVQYVIRPQTSELHDYRGYAGRIISGTYKVGSEISILPSGKASRISRIEFDEKNIQKAVTGQSVILHLEDDIDVSRGDLITTTRNLQPIVAKDQEALVCWMDERPLRAGKRYTVQLHSRRVTAIITEILHRVDVNTLEKIPAVQARLNEVVRIRLKTATPIAYDPYSSLQENGAFILIDETSHATAGGGLFQ
jgi:sulfate adenylyltransferase subunit 1